MEKFMMVDNIAVAIKDEKNVLEVIRKAGIDLPTFCYYSDLSIYGACRMCVVEDQWGGIEASCSMVPKEGMVVFTNTERLRKYRKNILELLLAEHCTDCTTCYRNLSCKLQSLALRFGINMTKYNYTKPEMQRDTSSLCIERHPEKCILCGDCVRMCAEVQNVGVIDFMHRGSKMTVDTAFGTPLAETNCVGCGQCAAVCPTGAIIVKRNINPIWEAITDKNTRVVVQIAPAVRVGIGRELGMEPGQNSMGRIVAVLRRMGFDQVFDTSTGADLTVMEETKEFVARLEKGEKLPLFTSCCPAWIQQVENQYPELLPNISTCRSPMQMFGSVIKEYYKNDDRKVVSVAIMPCTAKKFEAARDEFKIDGIPNIDYVLTTRELIHMVMESGILFNEVEEEAVDMPFGISSGAGVIFGVTGGVTEAVVRRVSEEKTNASLKNIAFKGVRGLKGVKEFILPVGENKVRIAIVSGLKNADTLIKKIQSGEVEYDFIEVMACPNGCISGAGQPHAKATLQEQRMEGLYEADRMSTVKRSEENPLMDSIYDKVIKGKEHEMLHVHYHSK